ncbi:hypothetical protein SDC9_143103 [bioreactor metagenome]|uniref:Uncharacterized protein n=1 Tax=bioreactor metagenome TaxID=1076179 RepID=A0A645E2M6_9ZZZZ
MRRLPGGGGEVLVAPAAVAAPGQHKGLVGGHVLNDFVGFRVPDHRAPGHLDEQGLPVLAGAAAAAAGLAAGSGVLALIAKIHQG